MSEVRKETVHACNALNDYFKDCYQVAQLALSEILTPFMIVSEGGRSITLRVNKDSTLRWSQPIDLDVFFVEKSVGHSIVGLYAIGSPVWDAEFSESRYDWKPRLSELREKLVLSLAEIERELEGTLVNQDSLVTYLREAIRFADQALEAGVFERSAYEDFALRSKNYLAAIETFSAVVDDAIDDLFVTLTDWKQQLGDSWERMIVAVKSDPPGPDPSKGATRSLTAETTANVHVIKSFMTPENAQRNVLFVREGAEPSLAISEAMLARRCAKSMFPTPESRKESYGNYEALHDSVNALINPAAAQRLRSLQQEAESTTDTE